MTTVKWLEQRRHQSAFQDLPRDVQELIARVRAHFPRADLDVLRDAYLFAEEAHRGQTRASGEPYVQHSLAVARILADLRLDPVTLAAALLHDVAEDTGVTLQQVEERFGAEIAGLVDGVTKLGRIQWQTREERQAESLRKMFLAMANDIRIVLIKLADRLHNMRTLAPLPEWKRKRTAQETLDIYAPLAERLGIGQLQSELEDLAFRELNPEAYQDIATQLAQAEEQRTAFLDRVIDVLHRELNRAGIRVERYSISARPKHIYSIWRKMQRPKYAGASVARIYDRLGVRIIVDTVPECYAALGVVHSLWRPIPGEFDDYIANPKTTGYQSLHTAVLYEGEPLEIQIRTAQMHHEAEYGIAAHWKYKEGKPAERALEQKLSWLRQLLEWHQEVQDARAFVQSVRLDLFQNEVFVFTPKGDVVDLPAGATPIDFAYRIHTEVGHRATGARVNGRLVPLSYRLRTGDIVEIITSKTASGPSRDWLTFVATSNARTKIKQWFKRERREENIQRGRELLEKELRRTGGGVAALRTERLREVARTLGLPSEEELLAAVGNGDVSILSVVQALRGETPAAAEPAPPDGAAPPAARGARGGVRVRGVDNALVRFSRCCTPLPGDRIVGYVTRGRGVAVHRADCPNMAFLRSHPERLLEVEWESLQNGSYPVEVEVEAFDRVGLLKDVLAAIAESRTNVVSVNARVRKDKVAIVNIVLDVHNLEQLRSVVQRVSQVSDVFNVERVLPE
ncbi:MAG: bifunctional (p)ppGpp synthetase/guanosine-3',5'-bis(diphosphate) 3'-pyrophosphohydrolase [Armatimonadota bacterium]|nr:bifunctional (p)ppGpp synthetase/guanosine-3',5'-bis(diphosphate) 3'-pyrophosphohydrolase [Armatimonadota bacterium]MDR7447587.1 bifunctional (p)ppGpp synthetase/guanosine-3',5'-bis(diphosphate) 3'-pyrophosphohydrolase [Armatimonadota bacterium]MDR7458754.1 bifunctional (p)ppGpp synthetase/guanosine-3',5'-bis(diphosphate) 3'-pyrophosphohydrolase [Armatimonadota bacterium]MDR7480510.1 bifunctional (p)ppGpp synthetase/guanosine-3',5'-bis(diphosphate) 3'-pyrophosphohydrolase [Armatimonadota bact